MAEAKHTLAAILAADAAGYSRLMAADDRATVVALDAARTVFRAAVDAEGGRVVDTAGDSVLAVFETPSSAVRAAMAAQNEINQTAEAVPEDRRMLFRIGITLGEVIEKSDGTVYGDGVNIAARLEAASEPGGITISGTVYDHVHNRIDIGYQDLGTLEVKNIPDPVRAYRVTTDATAPATETEPTLKLPDKPSIAVLPFDNLSGDPDQEYFADGIAEDLITALSRIRWLFVTARNSTFAYKGQSPDVRRVGTELGVRYVVEGSVRKGGERVRITAQLADAATGNHIWAERYDRELADMFALQDEISETLVAALQAEVGEFERDRAHRNPPESLDAWESYQRGLWHLWRMNAKDMAEACRLFQHAGELDPNFAQAFATLGYTLSVQIILFYTDSPLENLERALRFAKQGVDLDDKDAMAHFALGRVQLLRGEYETAIAALRTAINLNPSFALAQMGLGIALTLTERLDEAISAVDTAIRLSPRDPAAWAFYHVRAMARFLGEDYETVVEDERRAIRHSEAPFWPHATLASALALLDRHEEAKIALDKLLEIKPDFTPNDALASWSPPKPEALRPLFTKWVEGLCKAGLDIPDEWSAAN